MCRACYAVVVAPASEQAKLRRAAGLDVQVVATVEGMEEAAAIDPSPDVLIVHDSVAGRPASEGPAVVVVGAQAPDWADHAVPDDESLVDTLPGGVVKALVARRSR